MWAVGVVGAWMPLAAILLTPPVAAQVKDMQEDAKAARYDAMLGTPGGLVPLFFNSNADALPTGGTNSAEFSPLVNASWSTPVFDLPLRFTAGARAEVDRFTQVPASDFDKIGLSARLQHVDPNNDQAYSPYVSYAPRWDFDPFYRSRFATRQDINVGVNKTFNYDADFRRVAFSGNTIAETRWSFGVTAAIQRRFREPTPGSWAAFFVPSATYVISPQWNISAGIDLERRAFDPVNGFSQEDWLIEPIVTLEFVAPAEWFGSARTAAMIGRPALNFQAAYENNWSNAPGANFQAWHLGAALKLGWRF